MMFLLFFFNGLDNDRASLSGHYSKNFPLLLYVFNLLIPALLLGQLADID